MYAGHLSAQAYEQERAGREDVVQLKVGTQHTPYELLVEAVDADGKVDTDLNTFVLLEALSDRLLPATEGGEGNVRASSDCTIHGLGLIQINSGVGRTSIWTTKAGIVSLGLQDGAASEPALSTIAVPQPLELEFVSGRPKATQLVPKVVEAIAGTSVELHVRVVDEFQNCVTVRSTCSSSLSFYRHSLVQHLRG